jgi:3-dehydroquinate synthase
MITVTVDLKQRSYPIFIGSGLLNKPGLLDPYIEGRDVLVVTNESIAPLYLESLQQMLGQNRHSVVVLPDGEDHKNLTTLNLIFDELVAQRFGLYIGCTRRRRCRRYVRLCCCQLAAGR